MLGYASLERVPQGVARRVVFKRKPECDRKHKDSENVIPIKDWNSKRSQAARSKA
jgi:hypothetical protein